MTTRRKLPRTWWLSRCTERTRNWGWIPYRGRRRFSSPQRPGRRRDPNSLLSRRYRGLFQREQGEGGGKECVEMYLSIPTYIIMVWCLIKHRNNFPFTQYFYIPILSSIPLCSPSTHLPLPASRFVETPQFHFPSRFPG
jgi:hypothetical protein